MTESPGCCPARPAATVGAGASDGAGSAGYDATVRVLVGAGVALRGGGSAAVEVGVGVRVGVGVTVDVGVRVGVRVGVGVAVGDAVGVSSPAVVIGVTEIRGVTVTASTSGVSVGTGSITGL